MSIDAIRKRELGLIHMAKDQLGLSRDDYEQVLREVTGKTSAAGLDAAEREKLLKHLKKKGFALKPKGKQTRTLAQDAQSRKIRAMWLMLHTLGQVQDPSEAALQAFVKRMTKADALQRAKLYAVIEALKGWSMRHLPQYLKKEVLALDLDTLTPGQREDLSNMVQSVRRAKAKAMSPLNVEILSQRRRVNSDPSRRQP